MKILFVIGTLSGGGAERVISVLANAVIESGNSAAIVTMNCNESTYAVNKSIQILSPSMHRYPRGISFFARVFQLRKIIENYGPDHVVSFTAGINFYSIMACLGTRYDLICSERNDPNNDPGKKLNRIIRDIVYGAGKRFVFQTEDARRYFSKRIQKNSTVIGNPVRSDLPLHEESSGKKIVCVSRLEPQKNLQMLISGFAELVKEKTLDGYSLHIYGKGSMLEELKSLVDSYGIGESVVFEGFKNNVHEEIKDAEMFVLPSNYEGMSNAMLEAMAMGLPVISTDHPIGGAKMCIEDGKNGILIPVGDKAAMKEKILFLANSPIERSKISAEAEYIQYRKCTGTVVRVF